VAHRRGRPRYGRAVLEEAESGLGRGRLGRASRSRRPALARPDEEEGTHNPWQGSGSMTPRLTAELALLMEEEWYFSFSVFHDYHLHIP
jgi:hypothetical protein